MPHEEIDVDDHGRTHAGHEHGEQPLAPVFDPEIPDHELTSSDVSRRHFLRRLGLMGAATVGAGAVGFNPGRLLPAAASDGSGDDHEDGRRLLWLAGDHHTHTQYSSDARYKVQNHVGQASRFRIDWLVITDHGRVAHEKVAIDKIHPDILASRQMYPNLLTFQGLEWNIPGAEHGTIFFAPGNEETALLHEFERQFDGVVLFGAGATRNDPVVEARATEAIRWMSAQIKAGRSSNALFLANHPARRGVDSPHEFRNWNDTDSAIAVGMEGAPGHQAAGVAKSALGPEAARGFYDFAPGADSFPGYPLEAYRTFGGFDWMTAKVGGLWDSLLAEGRRFWITANSDSHAVYRDTVVRGAGNGKYDDPTSPYYGGYGDPVDTGVQQAGNGDFWPGYYSRTVVGATSRSYRAVMEGIRAGRSWVTHGDLIWGLDVRVGDDDRRATLGGTYTAERGGEVDVHMRITLPQSPNFNGDRPQLRRVDLIAGPVTGRAADRDGYLATGTSVVRSFEVSQSSGEIVLTHRFTNVPGPFYLRLRGTDGRAAAPGSIEPRLDPLPIDPWSDLWFYSNPVFVDVRGDGGDR